MYAAGGKASERKGKARTAGLSQMGGDAPAAKPGEKRCRLRAGGFRGRMASPPLSSRAAAGGDSSRAADVQACRGRPRRALPATRAGNFPGQTSVYHLSVGRSRQRRRRSMYRNGGEEKPAA